MNKRAKNKIRLLDLKNIKNDSKIHRNTIEELKENKQFNLFI